VGNREQNLQEAIRLLHSEDLQVTRLSPVYETRAVEVTAQPDFLNMVAECRTDLFPMRLLLRVLNIERKMGRKRLAAKGPRTIDIDILLFGSFVVKSEKLEIPHPGMVRRRFVLEPLSELAPELRHPESRQSIRELLEGVRGQVVRKWEWRPELPGA
jgi:2-amino-4-hydroxy-6-hydroxymethyldihydropteridine diphosphokinase